MVPESRDGSRLRYIIRSPTTLQRCQYYQRELQPCKRCFYTIITNCNGSLEAVDCDMHSVRYDIELGKEKRCSEAEWRVKNIRTRASCFV
eukprot:scaffold658_cov110-Skeletonema_marinoi.AAC.2